MSNVSLNNSADNMVDKIIEIIQSSLRKTPSYVGAIVDKVNPNGTVNVHLPPNTEAVFTNISNQTPFSLQEGDSVELLLKDGSFNNCWVAAKHQASFK